MRRKSNPYIDKSLVATRNGLWSNGINASHSMRVYTDARYGFGSGDFTLSMIVKIVNKLNDPIIFEIYNGVTNSKITIQYQIGIRVNYETDQGTTGGLVGSEVNAEDINRVTLIRRGASLEWWINNKLTTPTVTVPALDDFNFNDVGGRYSVSARYNPNTNSLEGLVSNLVILNTSIAHSQLVEFHQSNIIPKALHQYVIAHYPLNQNFGAKAYDCVEQYNYFKATPLVAIHGDLINYSSDELGTVNTLLQSAWQNIYTKRIQNSSFLKLITAGSYLAIPSLVAQTFATWTLYFDVIADDALSLHGLFNSGGDINKLVQIGYNGTLRADIYILGVDHVLNVPTTAGTRLRLFLESFGTGMTLSIFEGAADTANFSALTVFDVFNFATYGTGTNNYTKGLHKAVLVDRLLTQREKNILAQSDRSDDYRELLPIFDLDFSTVFYSAPDHFSKDISGNSNHAKVFNFTPASDLPVRIEPVNFFKEITSALVLNDVNAVSLKVAGANFNLTGENGYTFLIFATIKNILTKSWSGCARYDATTNKRYSLDITNMGVNSAINYQCGDNGSQLVSLLNFDSSKINDAVICIAGTSRNVGDPMKLYMNGILIQTTTKPGIDFNVSDGAYDFYVGLNPFASAPDNTFEWNFVALGVWKRVLNNVEIANLSNNTLFNNPSKESQKGLQLWAHPNADTIFNNGVDIVVKNQAPASEVQGGVPSSMDLLFQNLVGATLNDKLTNALSLLVDVNTLR